MVRAARPEKERNRRARDVLQVFVAQGVVAHQVRLALRKGKTGDWEPSARRPAEPRASTPSTSTTTSRPAYATTDQDSTAAEG